MIPAPMPDELGMGLAWRMAWLHGISSWKELRRATVGRAMKGHVHERFVSMATHLAAKLSMSIEEYSIAHSLVPFELAVRSSERESPDFTGSINWRMGEFDGPLDGAFRYCPKCAEYDADGHGFSWWRRQHQLPGVDGCLHHEIALARIVPRDAMLLTPSHYAAMATNRKDVPADFELPIVRRYRAFANWLLAQGVPLDRRAFARSIGERCGDRGIVRSTHRRSQGTKLSSYVRSVFPPSWLQRHYPKLLEARYQQRELGIDAAFFGQGGHGKTIAIILAALFEDPMDLEQQLGEARRNLILEPPVRHTCMNAIEFIHLFAQCEGEVKRIATQTGRSIGNIHTTRRRFELPRVGQLPASIRQSICTAFANASTDELLRWIPYHRDLRKSRGSFSEPIEEADLFFESIQPYASMSSSN